MSQQPPEKAYTPPLPGAAPPQVPGQYAQYPNQQFQQGQPPQYGPPQPEQQSQGQYGEAPNPQYPQDQYNQSYPPQGQYPQQYPPQPPPQAAQGQPQPQYQQQPYQQQPYPQQPPYPQQQPYPQQPYPPQQPYTTVVVQQQPLPIIGMSIAAPGGNRNVRNLRRDALGRRAWSFGLCDCCNDCGTWMLGFCCPCILYAQIKQRADYLNAYARPDPTRGGSGVDINCMVWTALHFSTGCGPALQAVTRGQIRNRYMIDGNGFGDFCAACWCTPCELTQEHRELELEEQALSK
ncbi:hypothetical protein AX14_001837 [Amanita brunnescens Koide BX004]|nr:hypothetical protein AX14_001837 [Amanita brunnescens Koide BX004]